MNDKQVRNRIYILIGFLCVVLCAFLLRLVQWQLIDGDEYLSHAESTSTYSFSATAARGEIVDCYGRSLATNETVYQIELNQLMMGDTDLNEIIRQLIEILEASGEEWNDTMLISEPDENGHYEFTNEPGNESQEARLAALKDSLGKQQYGTADQVMAVLVEKYGLEDYEPLWQRRIAGVRYQMTLEEFSVRNNFVFATDIGSVTMATIKERSMNLPGVQVIGTSRRNYPDGTILPHILGSVGSITAEQWRVEDEDGNVSYPLRDAGYNMNDLIGQSGLEKVYEEELRGTDGTTEIVVGDGEIQEIRTGVTPTPGKTVMLTINREFQKRVDEALERNILTLQQTKAENAGKECNAGAVVVIDVDTGGLLAVSLYEGDSLAWTKITSGEDELIVATKGGQAIRFKESDARSMGRLGHGVRAIRLAEGDQVVGVGILRPGATVFTVTEQGKGRRSRVDDYRIQSRGGKGIRNYTKGCVAGIKVLDDEDDVILISQEGIVIRMHAADINLQSRYGSGVRVMRLAEGDRVVTVARTEHSDDAVTEKPEDEPEETLTEAELAAIQAEENAQAEEQPEDEGDGE